MGSTDPLAKKLQGPSKIHLLQAQAFLDVHEDVGIDEETIADILQGLDELRDPVTGQYIRTEPPEDEDDDDIDASELLVYEEESTLVSESSLHDAGSLVPVTRLDDACYHYTCINSDLHQQWLFSE